MTADKAPNTNGVEIRIMLLINEGILAQENNDPITYFPPLLFQIEPT